jgi:hypothetical protein
VDIIKWRIRINNNEDLKKINKEVIDRIRTDGIPQLDFIFDKLEVMWDFATDKMGKEGVTLYANWVKDVKHTYDICYLDESNKPVIVYSYSVSEGDKFKDLLSKANSRNGYTALPSNI